MNNWRDHMPALSEGWSWEIETGPINYLFLRGTGYLDAGVISLAPNEFLEPFYAWTETRDISVLHLQRTANRLLRKWGSRAANLEAEKNWV